tara:strand:- start:362 stop:1588 length:1227 start_codon:yes stop_codon:yes gene_type:complete
MAKRDILKEAIADAKAVKETAIANAKAALEEAFTPQLKSMLAAKLEEMELDEELSDPDMRKYDDKGVEGGEEEEKTLNTEPGNDPEELDEEINLDEILAEIEGELNEDEKTKAEEEGYLDGMKDEKEDMEDKEDDSEEEEIDLEDMTDEDLKGFIEDVIADMVGSGELEAGENFEEEDTEEEVGVGVVDSEEEEVEITESEEKVDEVNTTGVPASYKAGNPYDTGEKSVSAEVAKALSKAGVNIKALGTKGLDAIAKMLDFSEPASPLQKKLRDAGTGKTQKFQNRFEEGLEEELKEAHSTIETLRSELNEVNLLNAKLLYTNKIFKAKSLTESEKVKVLGAFDKAATIKETKLVFETLNEGLKTKKNTIRESLGSASKATGNFKSNKKPIVETDPMVERFKKLAGLK